MKKISKTQAAYIAGFFDGEGCITCVKVKKHPRVRIQLTQKDVSILIKISKLLGYGHIHQKKSSGNHVWYLNSKIAQLHFIKSVLPYSVVKEKQLVLGLKFLETLSNSCGPGYPISKHTLKLRLKLCSKIKELKHAYIPKSL